MNITRGRGNINSSMNLKAQSESEQSVQKTTDRTKIQPLLLHLVKDKTCPKIPHRSSSAPLHATFGRFLKCPVGVTLLYEHVPDKLECVCVGLNGLL